VGEDEVTIEVHGHLVILSSLGELALDKVELRAVVVDIGILVVGGEGSSEVLESLVGITYDFVLAKKKKKICY